MQAVCFSDYVLGFNIPWLYNTPDLERSYLDLASNPPNEELVPMVALNDALEILGVKWRSVILAHLERLFGERLYDDALSIRDLERVLAGIFGNGSALIIDRLRITIAKTSDN